MDFTDGTARLLEECREAILARGAGRRELVATIGDRIASHNKRMTGLGLQASRFCTMGCARCCAMIFFVTPPEVEVIAFHLLERPELLALFLRNSRRREELLVHHGHLWSRCQAATHADDPALAAFYAQDIRCAFIADGSCTIYPVRPLACSLYNSIVPAEVCAVEPKVYETEEMRHLHGEMRQELARLCRGAFPAGEWRLDVSRKVLLRLVELAEHTEKPKE